MEVRPSTGRAVSELMVNPIEFVISGRGNFRPFCLGCDNAPYRTLKEIHLFVIFFALNAQDFFFLPVKRSARGRNQG